MRLTKKRAIQECKELWEAIAESGLSKMGFFYTEESEEWRKKDYQSDCPLCAYDAQRHRIGITWCHYCPLRTQYKNDCSSLGFVMHRVPSTEWLDSIKGLKE